MVNKTATIKKQGIAFLLMAVFLFIHAGKLLHNHEQRFTAENSLTSEQVAKSADCSVCDFHLATDADGDVSFVTLSKHRLIKPQPFSYQSRTSTSVGLRYADRGPPAFA